MKSGILLVVIVILIGTLLIAPFAASQSPILTESIPGGVASSGPSPPPPSGPTGGVLDPPHLFLNTRLIFPWNAIQFSFANATGVTSFLWGFGDGSTSSEASPTHTYAVPAFAQQYRYWLYSCNLSGCSQEFGFVWVFNLMDFLLAGVLIAVVPIAVILSLKAASIRRADQKIGHLRIDTRLHAPKTRVVSRDVVRKMPRTKIRFR